MALHLIGAVKNVVKAVNDFSEGNDAQGCKNLTKAAVGAVIPFGGLMVEAIVHNPESAAHAAWEHRDDITDSVQDIFS